VGEQMMDMGKMWDMKFSREGYLYGLKPNAFLVSQKGLVPERGSILLLGEGEGRNAAYFAKEGFDVTALDASPVGLTKAGALAKEMGVEVSLVLQDLGHWSANTHYDAVMTSYLHLKEPLRSKAFKEALKALNPSGYFIAEFFSLSQLGRSSGGPQNEALLYTVEDMQTIFSDEAVEIVMLEEVEDMLDEGVGHQGMAKIIRVVVKKDAA